MMTMTAHQAEVTLPSDREVKITRSFNAPRDLVYRAFIEPALLKRWMLGPPGWTMPICEMDVRVGGKFRWQWRSEDGKQEFGFYGEFREVEPGVKIVHTESFDPGTMGGEHSGGEALITALFTESGGVTTVTTLMDFGSQEARDKAVATGMTGGMEQSYQLLDTLLAEQG
jgi:uncharacterized protein YndB with AHSA1/START domain